MKNEANGKYKKFVYLNNNKYWGFEIINPLTLIMILAYALLPFIMFIMYNGDGNITIASYTILIGVFTISVQMLRSNGNRVSNFIDRYAIMITEISLEDGIISIQNMGKEDIYQYELIDVSLDGNILLKNKHYTLLKKDLVQDINVSSIHKTLEFEANITYQIIIYYQDRALLLDCMQSMVRESDGKYRVNRNKQCKIYKKLYCKGGIYN